MKPRWKRPGAAPRRNLQHCQDGLFSCDPTELTETEAKAVRTIYERRNQASCRDGLASCQPLELRDPDLNASRSGFRSSRTP